MKNRVILASVVAFTLVAASVKADTIAQWTFEHFTTNNVNTSGPLSPEWGLQTATAIGTASHVGATVYSEPAGDVDPTIAASDAGAVHAGDASSLRSWSANVWAIGDYFQFHVSTLGFTGVEVEWDQTGSNTGPRDFQLQYSTDGVNFATNSAYSLAAASWNTSSAVGNSLSGTFAGAVDGQANVYFRIVDNSTVNIVGGAIGTGGTGRIDNFTVIAVPEPSTVLLVGAGLVGMLAMRRRRS